MILKYLLTAITIGLTLSCFAQEKADENQPLTNRKVGIYATYQEFLKNEPSITKAFAVIPIFYIDKVKMDSTIVGFTYRFQDSSKPFKKVWGLYDGDKTYYNLDYLSLIPFSYTGRYSMVIQDTGTHRMSYDGSQFSSILGGAYGTYNAAKVGLGLMGLGVFVLDNWILNSNKDDNRPIKITKKTVMYINRKGELMSTTGQAIGFFLRGEKDLSQAFNKEKMATADVYIKYIMAMNARYPL